MKGGDDCEDQDEGQEEGQRQGVLMDYAMRVKEPGPEPGRHMQRKARHHWERQEETREELAERIEREVARQRLARTSDIGEFLGPGSQRVLCIIMQGSPEHWVPLTHKRAWPSDMTVSGHPVLAGHVNEHCRRLEKFTMERAPSDQCAVRFWSIASLAFPKANLALNDGWLIGPALVRTISGVLTWVPE